MAEQETNVSTPGTIWNQRSLVFKLMQDLLGGTKAMREAGRDWLPKEEAEEKTPYIVRLERSILYGMLKDTIKRLTSKPFSKPLTLDGELPEALELIRMDVDRTGKDLDAFARELFQAALKDGLCHVLVDFARMDSGATIADEKAAGARPTFVIVTAPQLIGFKTERNDQGHSTLSEIRILETTIEDDGDWGDKEVRRVRVYRRETWEIHEEDKEGKWGITESGTHTFGEVPLATFYTNRVAHMDADPPLEDLAWLNLAHWQSLSDQRNLLRFVRCGILFAKGFTKDEIETGIVIGPNNIVSTSNKDGTLAYVEHSGKGLGAGADDLAALEERAEVMGMQPLIARTAKSTATGKVIDETRVTTDIQSWIGDEETFLVVLFMMAGKWIDVKVPDSFLIHIFSDFGIGIKAQEEIKNLITMRQSGEITQKTFLIEVKRRGLLHEDTDIDQEIVDLGTEGPALGGLGVEE